MCGALDYDATSNKLVVVQAVQVNAQASGH